MSALVHRHRPRYEPTITAPSARRWRLARHGDCSATVTPQEHWAAQRRDVCAKGLIAYKIRGHARRPRPSHARAPATATDDSAAPRYAFSTGTRQFDLSLDSPNARPRITRRKPCGPTSTKKPNSAQLLRPKHCRMQTKNHRMRIWQDLEDVLEGPGAVKAVAGWCDVSRGGISLLPIILNFGGFGRLFAPLSPAAFTSPSGRMRMMDR